MLQVRSRAPTRLIPYDMQSNPRVHPGSTWARKMYERQDCIRRSVDEGTFPRAEGGRRAGPRLVATI